MEGTTQAEENVEKITGWGLNNPFPTILNRIATGELGGFCRDSDTCDHHSHDPQGPVYELTPKPGYSIVKIDDWFDKEDRTTYTYYDVIGNNNVVSFSVKDPVNFNAYAEEFIPNVD